MKPFLNLDELEDFEASDDGRYGERYAPVSPKIGAQLLGYSLSIVPPGKRVCPFHNHRINEEMFLILEGEGTLRFGDQEYPVRKHDIIACPPGDRSVAHQIVNTSGADLTYLCLSTRLPYEIAEYPDSDKIMAMVGEHGDLRLRHITRADSAVDYMDGER